MNTPEHKFITLPQFLELSQRYWSDLGWVFRGQDNLEWPLVPKAGRQEYYREAIGVWAERGQSSSDLGRFKSWREQAVAFCPSLPENDFECLAFAQHYGLATRLLDWTTNPLVALFFAVEMQSDVDGAVFCHNPWWIIERETSSIERPFDKVGMLIPRPFDRRIVAQSGVFTYHFNPREPMVANEVTGEARQAAPEGVNLVMLRVIGKTKRILQDHLSAIGISRKSLFPDLEGLSSFVNWETRKQVAGHLRYKDQAK